jgi:hypothetical protein
MAAATGRTGQLADAASPPLSASLHALLGRKLARAGKIMSKAGLNVLGVARSGRVQSGSLEEVRPPADKLSDTVLR